MNRSKDIEQPGQPKRTSGRQSTVLPPVSSRLISSSRLEFAENGVTVEAHVEVIETRGKGSPVRAELFSLASSWGDKS